MHRDTKVGLALGVLLVGVVGAFFFRNEGKSETEYPELLGAVGIDEEIAGHDVIPYLDDGQNTPVDPQGPVPSVPRPTGNATPPWELPSATKDAGRTDLALGPLPPMGGNGTSVDLASRTRRVSDDTDSNSSGERFHVVASGDTLTGIAEKYLGSTARYLDVYEANRDQMSSPDRLKLGQKLRIPDGRPPRSEPPATRSTRPDPKAGPVPSPRALTEETVAPSAPAGTLPELETIELESTELSPTPGEPAGDTEPTRPRNLFVPARRTPFVPR